MGSTGRTISTCVVIVEVRVDGEATVLGILTDSVQEVIELDAPQIEPPPRIGARLRTDFIRGVGKRESGLLMLLDIDRVFAAEEIREIAGAAMPEERAA